MGEAGVGVTESKRIRCSDGRLHLVKFSRPAFPKLVVNELLAAGIGEMLHAPIAGGEPVLVEEALAASLVFASGEHVTSGVHFAVPWVEPAYANPSAEMLSRAQNHDMVPTIFIFDQLINNHDRAGNRGNLLVGADEDGNLRIYAIDHGHAFAGPNWSPMDLAAARDAFPPVGGDVYNRLTRFVVGRDPFADGLTRLEAITPSQVADMLAGIGTHIGLIPVDHHALHDFLTHRIGQVRSSLERNRMGFPSWN